MEMYKKTANPSTCGKTEQRYCTSDQEDLGGSRGYIISPLEETARPYKIGGRVWPGLVCHRAPASRVSRRLLHRARMSFSLSSLRGHPCMLPEAGVAPLGESDIAKGWRQLIADKPRMAVLWKAAKLDGADHRLD